ncbi:bifunctional MaoC family dehydratase N-terminal/OB-fold nucleic acid binding domain-containing protein [Nocardioides sp. LS1]|uniref:bifunctional MaoC family dehydratase N-terminal/OB-fold nucleic acid binding domain-containing protein n=1 Tax=Nocardioides sp. LS1 TaxID=1027620 RepID=UPI000F625F66|nr:bifunctional MaoC family dehydratase N-terminal/OB-fold nucleic acid binding domain-containing protein [Nocardioides sp. LS1]GCD89315.1 DNA-binding protein [Nocardioides sp. LS1]
MTHDLIMAEAARIQELGETAGREARDPVNQPTINNWLEAMGNTNPRFAAGSGRGEAPPSMAQVWTMYGLGGRPPADDPLHGMMNVLTDAGYTAVLGTNCEQEYVRYLRVGEQVRVTTALDSVVGPKQTAMGEGYFVTSRSTWYVGSEVVATMLFRVLKYRPKVPSVVEQSSVVEPAETFVLRPMKNRDTEFFWDGTAAGELRIQSCNGCGALRFPPGPACPDCGALDRGHVVASGRGTVFSYVVHRHPPVPGRDLPILIALVDLEEGVRMVGELVGLEPDDIKIGMPVSVDFRRIDDDLTLPVWRTS